MIYIIDFLFLLTIFLFNYISNAVITRWNLDYFYVIQEKMNINNDIFPFYFLRDKKYLYILIIILNK